MKKNLIAIMTAAAMAASMGTAALAENDDVTVIVNGETIDFTGDQAPVIVEERTLVPFRAVFEKMGAEVNWYPDSQTCEAIYGSIVVTLAIGENIMHIGDGTTVEVDVPAQIMNDRTMVPIRVISEGMGALVGWDESTYTVTVNSPEKTEERPETLNSIVSSKGYTSETTGVTVTFDFPVVTDEFTTSGQLNDSILGDIIDVATKVADEYTGEEKELNISYQINKNDSGLFEVLYTIDGADLVYNATYATATGTKIDDSYLTEIYGESTGYTILTYSPEKQDADGHTIKANVEYPKFDENNEIIASLNTQLENSAKKSADEYLASYSEAAETDGENSFDVHCSVEISDDNIATVTMEYVEVINGETNKSADILTVNLTTGEVTEAE
jgi:hypothetical protein